MGRYILAEQIRAVCRLLLCGRTLWRMLFQILCRRLRNTENGVAFVWKNVL